MSETENPLEILATRTVIPTWKAPDQAIELSTSNQRILETRKALARRWLQKLQSGYEQDPTDHKAVEIYETALMYGLVNDIPNEARQLGMSALKHTKIKDSSLWDTEQRTKENIFSEATSSNQKYFGFRSGVQTFKKLLAENPNRPFCWSELARHYLVLNEDEKADRAMMAALKLAKDNRYLSRAATRLFVQQKKYDKALNVLHSVPGFINDPWLLSAEIATTSFTSKTSRHIKNAQKLVESKNFTPYQLSELAAAIGTVEMHNGAAKKAKQFFNTSFQAPTANSLAQGQWAVQKDSSIIIPLSAWNETIEPYEAHALAARQERNWLEVMKMCAKWLEDEPYSLRPTIMASYISFSPELYQFAEQFATFGLLSDPNNHILLNNRAVARTYSGDLIGAISDIKLAISSTEGKNSAHLNATFGLVAFRCNYQDIGREYYKTSISWFSKKRDKEALYSAILHYLREEARFDLLIVPQAIEITKKILNSNTAVNSPELAGFSEVLLSELVNSDKKEEVDFERINVPETLDYFQSQASLFEFPLREENNLSQLVRDVRDLMKLL